MTNKNYLYYGDNLKIMNEYLFKDTIDLCYIDPPFNSKRNYNQIYNNIGKEDKAQAQAFIDTWIWDYNASENFEAIASNECQLFTAQSIATIIGLKNILGQDSLLAYLVNMTRRIAKIYDVLKPTGSFYLHCDQTASHYLKLICDAIFCARKGEFQNEIIWNYKRWTGTSNQFQRMHDTILFYTKSDKFTFNIQFEDYQQKTLNMYRAKNKDEKGEFYWKRGRNIEPYKIYKNDKGVQRSDVWDIPRLGPNSKSRLGYPTQKPESILDLIIEASSNENDIVLDAYCGGGTTVISAEKLKRRWIGIDITYKSIEITSMRLQDDFGSDILQTFHVRGIPEDFESAIALAKKTQENGKKDQAKEFEIWIISEYTNKKAITNPIRSGDGGIDGLLYFREMADNISNPYEAKMIFSVKAGSCNIQEITRLYGALEKHDAKYGVLFVAKKTAGMLKEAAQYGMKKYNYTGKMIPVIQVIDIEDILNGIKSEINSSISGTPQKHNGFTSLNSKQTAKQYISHSLLAKDLYYEDLFL